MNLTIRLGVPLLCAAGAFASSALSCLVGAPQAPAAPRSTADSLHLILIGPKRGQFEPCGCTGGQTGGLARMSTKLTLMTDEDPGAVVIDAGGLVRSALPIEAIRAEKAAQIYNKLPISAIGLSPLDVAHGKDASRLRAQLMENLFSGKATALHRNVFSTAESLAESAAQSAPAGPDVTARAVIEGKSKSGKARLVDVVSVPALTAAGTPDPAYGADAYKTLFAASSPDAFRVVVFHGLQQDARRFASVVPGVDLIVFGEGAGGPSEAPEKSGDTLLLFAGEKSQYVVDLHLSKENGKARVDAYKSESITAGMPSDKGVQELIDGYRETLRDDKWVEKLSGKATPLAQGAPVGSDACRSCHRAEYKVWEGSKHRHGVESLVKSNRSKFGQFDPDCLKCHAVGWFNGEGAGAPGGYGNTGESKDVRDYVGCESCHGPGSEHVREHKAAVSDDEHRAVKAKMMKDVTCQQCHDHENSPEFDRNAYWQRIKHGK